MDSTKEYSIWKPDETYLMENIFSVCILCIKVSKVVADHNSVLAQCQR